VPERAEVEVADSRSSLQGYPDVAPYLAGSERLALAVGEHQPFAA